MRAKQTKCTYLILIKKRARYAPLQSLESRSNCFNLDCVGGAREAVGEAIQDLLHDFRLVGVEHVAHETVILKHVV